MVLGLSMTSGTISHSAAAEKRAPSLSEDLLEMLCKIMASQAKDGVRQSVTFVDGHCELCVVIRTNVARLLYDFWNNLPLCTRSVKTFMKPS